MEEPASLIIADDPVLQRQLVTVVRRFGLKANLVTSPEGALTLFPRQRFALTAIQANLLLPLADPKLERLKGDHSDLGPIVAVTADPRVAAMVGGGSARTAVQVCDPDEVEHVIQNLLAVASGEAGEEEPAIRTRREVALWRSPRMAEVRDMVARAATVDVTVLITGETGTGKDVVGRAIHYFSSRCDQPFVKVNCAAVPRELLESELFGHERGAFTGAHQLKPGKFEVAHRGSIFLDEIGDLHPALQAKLLHVLQDGEFSRVGGRAPIRVDVRVLAATNQDLEQAVERGRFREDLYYRLNVIHIAVPPLRERRDEIPILARHLAERYAKAFRREGFTLSPTDIDLLTAHDYPGNVRELENILKRMVVLGGDPLLERTASRRTGTDQAAAPAPPAPASLSLKEIARRASREAERRAIAMMLEQTRWNRTKAASLLRISYRALLYKIKEAGLDGGRPSSRRAS